MGSILRFDHVGITVSDLAASIAFFEQVGLVLDGPSASIEGRFIDAVTGIDGASTEIVMMRTPDGGTAVELSRFVRPQAVPGSQHAMANELGLRSVAFEVEDLVGLVDRLGVAGFPLIGSIGEYERVWRMAYVRGPDGITVALAEKIG
ncbi:MAG TPA: VOC family protein [Candidatus Nanopelagicales bacterium]|nr:VOC family protein [Candidatus Nanopelagicales bacterium]